MRYATTALAALLAGGIILVGVLYLVAPDSIVPSFGLSEWPQGEARAFFAVKGIRDVVSGLIVLVLLATGHRRALGWVALVAAITPIGDAAIVLAHGGSAAIAFGVHGLTAAAVAAAGILLLRESPARDEGR